MNKYRNNNDLRGEAYQAHVLYYEYYDNSVAIEEAVMLRLLKQRTIDLPIISI